MKKKPVVECVPAISNSTTTVPRRAPGIGLVMASLFATLMLSSAAPAQEVRTHGESLWARANLFAWGAAPFDARGRNPEERAQMLEALGFRRLAYNWRDQHVPLFDAEITALRRHGIDVLAWTLYAIDDPKITVSWSDYPVAAPDVLLGLKQSKAPHLTLEELLRRFQERGIRPDLWLVQVLKPLSLSTTSGTMSSDEAQAVAMKTWHRDLTSDPQERRVREETDRIAALAKLTARYGIRLELYNHNGWFGMMENQVAVIERLRSLGVRDVGLVYNFDHARDAMHDDTKDFTSLWAKIKPYVTAVNLSGTAREPRHLYPSQGDRELEMMRIIQDSGWQGPVGLNTEVGGDAEVTLRNDLTGLDWLAAELKQPGSGGPRPFPPAP